MVKFLIHWIDHITDFLCRTIPALRPKWPVYAASIAAKPDLPGSAESPCRGPASDKYTLFFHLCSQL